MFRVPRAWLEKSEQMKLLKYMIMLLFLAVIIGGLSSCKYDSEEDLYGIDDCDTDGVTYQDNILPILNRSCTACHSGASPSGGVGLDNFDLVKISADNGSLLGSINHDSGFSPMPKGQDKLSECEIKQVKSWINNGMLYD